MKLTILDVQQVQNKQGRSFCFIFAETKPNPGETFWSTIRWQCILSDEKPPVDWRPGNTVDVRVRTINYEKGEAVFDVPKSLPGSVDEKRKA